MLKLLPFLTSLTLINALSVTQHRSQIIIEDGDLQTLGHLNLEGPDNIAKKIVKYGFIINCSGVIDNETLTEFPKLADLIITNSRIEEINTTLSIKHLAVQNSHFPNLDEDLQQKLPELEMLWLWDNKDFQVDPHKLKNFKKLTSLISFKTNFTEDCITNKWFKGLNLYELYLRDCNISCISKDAFNSLKNLGYLDLSYNHISNFEQTTFKNLTELRYLQIFGNDIETIDLNTFASQKKSLEQLGISWNVLKQSKIAAEQLLKAFPNLIFLDIPEKESIDSKAMEFCKLVRQNGTLCMHKVTPTLTTEMNKLSPLSKR